MEEAANQVDESTEDDEDGNLVILLFILFSFS